MLIRRSLFAVLSVVVTAFGQDVVVDDFENGKNQAGWSFNVTTPDRIETSGGNPNGWLHNPFVVSFAPIATTRFGLDSPFVGNLRAKGVTRISVDAQTINTSFGAPDREFSILLRDLNGTISDPTDDDYAYFVGPLVPQMGEGWKSYSFDIPSDFTGKVPPGWKGGWGGDLENFRPGVEWSDVIQDVERVEFWWINPSFFAIIQDWDVGIDNARVEFDPCNGNEQIERLKCRTRNGKAKRLQFRVSGATVGSTYTAILDTGQSITRTAQGKRVKFKFKNQSAPPCGPNGVTVCGERVSFDCNC